MKNTIALVLAGLFSFSIQATSLENSTGLIIAEGEHAGIEIGAVVVHEFLATEKLCYSGNADQVVKVIESALAGDQAAEVVFDEETQSIKVTMGSYATNRDLEDVYTVYVLACP